MSAGNQYVPIRTGGRRFSFGALLPGLLLGILLGFLLFLSVGLLARAGASLGGAGLLSRFAAYVTGRSTSIDVTSPAVVDKIRQLSRLETVVYSLDKIVTGGRENAYIPDFLVGDKLLLVAHGEVIAGVDMAQLQLADVSVSGDRVKVRLPAAQVLTTRIDNGRTRIYSRTTGLLVSADQNLESEVRLAAEQQIAQAALSDGILDKARENARASVTALLYGLGFHTVDVE
jgi:predicted transcriptional regulator